MSSRNKPEAGETKGARILFVAGGTGGHLFPALAVADRCRELDPQSTIQFVGGRGRIEEEVVPRAGYDLDLLWISGFDRRISLKNLVLPFKVLRSLMQANSILSRFAPDAIVCAGAYVSWPVGWSAVRRGMPLVLMESNALPGMVIRQLASRAREVHVAFDETVRRLPEADCVVSGNPVRRNLHRIPTREEGRRHFGLDPDRPTIFAFGGSLGARSINRGLDRIIERLTSAGIQVIWQTGRSYEGEELQEGGLYRRRFIYDMAEAYAAADLIVARAGATTIAELRAVGRPSILIPLPTAADDHQRINAEAMVAEGAAEMITDDRLDAELEERITGLLSSPERLKSMSENARANAVLDADDRIARSILQLISAQRA